MEGLAITLFAAFAVFAVWMAIHSWAAEKKRREALAFLAGSRGWSYEAKDSAALDEHYQYFDILRQGSNRYAYNIIRGEERGRPFLLFDYHYETHSSDSKGHRQTHHHSFTALIVETGLRFPSELKVRPEGFFDKLTSLVGFSDINFESDAFSRAWHVKAKDRKFAYDVIHPLMMEYLMGRREYSFEIERSAMIAHHGERTLEPERSMPLMRFAYDVLERLPEYLKAQLPKG